MWERPCFPLLRRVLYDFRWSTSLLYRFKILIKYPVFPAQILIRFGQVGVFILPGFQLSFRPGYRLATTPNCKASQRGPPKEKATWLALAQTSIDPLTVMI